MSVLVLIVLAVVVGALPREVQSLRSRVETLEFATAGLTVDRSPVSDVDVPARTASRPPAPVPVRVPLPEPIAPRQGEAATADSVETVAEEDPRSGGGFEETFGRRLPIWAGGVTLAVAGFLVVKYSIDVGLLSPIVRVALGLLFGTVLIGAAEAALRRHDLVGDTRVRQALAGAGVATLYGAVLLAADLYHLIGPATAFVGMTLVTVLAGGLAVRFGASSAVLGLLGGLSAPALVDSSQPDVPLLALYLTLTIGGLAALGRRQRWWWLGAAALTGGFGWGMLLIVGGALDAGATLSVGLLTMTLAVALPLLLAGERSGVVRIAAMVAGCTQMAALVALGGFAPLDWGLHGLLSVAVVWLSRRERIYADLPALALSVGVALAALWSQPSRAALALVLAGMVIVYVAPTALRVWRDDRARSDDVTVALAAIAIGILPAWHTGAMNALLGLPALLGAAIAGGIAMMGWRVTDRRDDGRFATLVIAAAALIGLAGTLGLASWTIPPTIAMLALGLDKLGRIGDDERIERGGWVFASAAVLVLLSAHDDLVRAVGLGTEADWTAVVRWLVPALVATAFAAFSRKPATSAGQVLAVLVGYGAAAQVLPAAWLAVVPPLALIAAVSLRAVPAMAAASGIAAAWALSPLLVWIIGTRMSLFGDPVFVSSLPTPWDAGTRLALPALAFATLASRRVAPDGARRLATGAAVALGIVAGHVLAKQIFAIDDQARFVLHAMAERTVWEMSLAGAALLAWRLLARPATIVLGIASIAHFEWFTMLVSNPLWTIERVGLWLTPAYATALTLLWTGSRALPAWRRERGWGLMAVIALFAFSLLRQLAHGAMPLHLGATGAEDIGRSLLGIALAIGFLRYGIARRLQDWRIASLALMVVAVGKVFLFDAAGLDGLLRIGSFAALGVSLIGVGWLYSRYLGQGTAPDR